MSFGHPTCPSHVQQSGYMSLRRRELDAQSVGSAARQPNRQARPKAAYAGHGEEGGQLRCSVADEQARQHPRFRWKRWTSSRPVRTYSPNPYRRRVRELLRGDRGAVSAELVVATPLLLLMLLLLVQFALWSHATHIAQAAASQGVAVARAQNGSAAAGSASAQRMLDQLASGPLTGADVTADRTTTSASIRITGTATSVIPFLSLPVHAEAVGPVERFVPDLVGG